MRVGYARVSTRGQAADGTSLVSQEAELRRRGCSEVVSEAYTGTSGRRPALDALVARLSEGDELVVCKMDRLARSVAAGLELLEALEGRGVTVEVLNMGVLTCAPTARLLRTMMLAVAEFERDMIVERMAEGRARAAEADPSRRPGRRRALAGSEGLAGHLEAVAEGRETVAEACGALGVSRSTWYREARRARAA